MKTLFYLILLAGMLSFVCSGCEQEKEINGDNDPLVVSGKIINHTDCKFIKSSHNDSETPDTLSCISYEFNASQNKLKLHHINAGFNCCFDSVYCEISVSNDTISIQEFENEALCDCNCLYDLDIELKGIEPKKYYVKITEPYCGDQEKLFFNADLTSSNEGTYCVTRKLYPWGQIDYGGNTPLDFSGELISNSDCKTFKSGSLKNNTPDTLSCINFMFNASNNELILEHINAGFNCCPDSLYCDVSLSSDTIIIQEFENGSLCNCLCLYDLTIKLYGVESKTYVVKFIEPYAGDMEKFNFELDLLSSHEGSYCVTRIQYPWGI